VAKVVEACSDSLADTAKGERKEDWQKRKTAYIGHLDKADDDVPRVSLADKVHNARAILRDLRKDDVGERIWSRFSQPRDKTLGTTTALPTNSAKGCPASWPMSRTKLSKCSTSQTKVNRVSPT